MFPCPSLWVVQGMGKCHIGTLILQAYTPHGISCCAGNWPIESHLKLDKPCIFLLLHHSRAKIELSFAAFLPLWQHFASPDGLKEYLLSTSDGAVSVILNRFLCTNHPRIIL